MKLTPRKTTIEDVPSVWAEMYRIPSSMASASFPCGVRMEIKGGDKSTPKLFVYEEDFSSYLVALIHMRAISDLILQRRMSIFCLQYDPIFDISYDGGMAIFSRSDFRFTDTISNILRDMKLCINEIIHIGLVENDELGRAISKAVARLQSDYVGIGYAVPA